MKKVFGIIMLIAGFGGIAGNIAKASVSNESPFQGILFGIIFFAIGIYYLTSKSTKKVEDSVSQEDITEQK